MVSAVMYERRRETIDRAHDFSESLELHQQVYRPSEPVSRKKPALAMRGAHYRAQRAFAIEESEETNTKEVSQTDSRTN